MIGGHREYDDYEFALLKRCEQVLRDYVEHQRQYDREMTATEVRARQELYWLDAHRRDRPTILEPA